MIEVTIGIKAYNEGPRIARALASAAAALDELAKRGATGEIVLADSGSTDRTIEIARGFAGVRIVQLANPQERGCGAGAQLAFQVARGRYFYLLDGDMELQPDFIGRALDFLTAHPDHAGVGGLVREAETSGIEFQLRDRTKRERAARRDSTGPVRQVDRLDCGGLYRCDAVQATGYYADCNLHSFEEFDLAARLASRGWKLSRIEVHAVDHFGHTAGGFKLMWRRLRTGYAGGAGEVVRAAFGRPHFALVVRHFVQLRFALVVIGWWLGLALAIGWGAWPVFAGLGAAPFVLLSFRRGSLRLGAYTVAVWNYQAIGLIAGLLRSRRSPTQPLAMREIGPLAE